MILVLIGVLGLVFWIAIAGLFLALCCMAGRADALATAGVVPDGTVVDLREVAETRRPRVERRDRGRGGAKAAGAYFRSRESRRSLSSLPSVWQVGQ